jgi:hypothetical protein
MNGESSQGLIGLAYDALSTSGVEPATVMSSLVSNKILPRDIIGFRGCPADSLNTSLISWGEDDRSLTCGGYVGWAKVVDPTHYTVNVVGIAVNGTWLNLPTQGWQEGLNNHSIVDSCTTLVYVPQFVHDELMAAVSRSGVFDNLRGLSFTNIQRFLYQLYSLPAVCGRF